MAQSGDSELFAGMFSVVSYWGSMLLAAGSSHDWTNGPMKMFYSFGGMKVLAYARAWPVGNTLTAAAVESKRTRQVGLITSIPGCFPGQAPAGKWNRSVTCYKEQFSDKNQKLSQLRVAIFFLCGLRAFVYFFFVDLNCQGGNNSWNSKSGQTNSVKPFGNNFATSNRFYMK